MQTWQERAQDMAPGSRYKIECECGAGPALSINRELDHAWCYCFRCGKSERKNFGCSLQDRIKNLEQRRRGDAELARDPLPRLVLDPALWPQAHAAWICRAGISFKEAAACGIGWAVQAGRLVIPFAGGWQARSLEPDRPKYLTSRPSPGMAAFGAGSTLVIVEDLLSAIRLSSPRVGDVQSLCLLGTHASQAATSHMVHHANRGGDLVIWLDPDRAGQAKAADLRRSLQALGLRTRSVVSRLDPKLHCDGDLRLYLRE